MGILSRVKSFFSTRSPREAIRIVEELKNKIVALAGESSPFSSDAKEAYYSLVSAYQLYSAGKNETVPGLVERARNKAAQCASYLKSKDQALAAEWEKAVAHAAQLIWAPTKKDTIALPSLPAFIPAQKDKEMSVKRVQDAKKTLKTLQELTIDAAAYWKKHKMNDLVREAFIKNAQDALAQSKEAVDSIQEKVSSASQALYFGYTRYESLCDDLVKQKDKTAEKLAATIRETLASFWQTMSEEIGFRLTRWQHKITTDNNSCTLTCAACDKTAATFVHGEAPMNQGIRIVYNGSTGVSTLLVTLKKPLFSFLQTGNLAGAHLFVRAYSMREGIDVYCVECDKAYCPDHFTTREEYDDGFYDYTNGTCPLGHTRKIDD